MSVDELLSDMEERGVEVDRVSVYEQDSCELLFFELDTSEITNRAQGHRIVDKFEEKLLEELEDDVVPVVVHDRLSLMDLSEEQERYISDAVNKHSE